MAKRPKRKYISKNNQEQLLQTFCDNLGNHENTFLGHKFKHKDGSIVESGTNLEQESDGEDGDNALELIVDSATDTDNEPLVEAFNGDDIAENDHRDDNEPADKVDYQLPIEQSKKQKLKNLDKVLDEGKCQDLPAQQKCCFKYMGAKKTVKIK